MKRIIVLVFCILCFSFVQAQEIPNLEATTLLSCKNFTIGAGLTSKMVSVKDVDFRVGYVSGNKFVMGLSYDLSNLDKIGDVEYIWKGSLTTSFLLWGGLDFDTGEYDYGVSVILGSIKFGEGGN